MTAEKISDFSGSNGNIIAQTVFSALTIAFYERKVPSCQCINEIWHFKGQPTHCLVISSRRLKDMLFTRNTPFVGDDNKVDSNSFALAYITEKG